jgi:DNA invertase Pin-like site-specific DNA recombinase
MLKLAEEGVIYARVSSARQVREGRGLQSQVSACQRYAKENDIKIVEVFEDPAQSGKDLNRPGMINLLSFLSKRKNLTYVLVEDISRLSRNVREYYALKDLIQSKSGLLKDLKNQIGDIEDPNSELTEGVIALVAQQNRIVNRLEVISKQKENLLSGRWVYPAPVGYVFKDKHLVVNQERAKLIKKIFKDGISSIRKKNCRIHDWY